MNKNHNHSFFHDEETWVHLIVNDKDEYFFPCPHCAPSYLTYKPEIKTHEICYNMGTEICDNCHEPECRYAGCNPVQSLQGSVKNE